MSKIVSPVAVAIGVGLAALVVVSGFRTSSAQFVASTDNTGNLWQAAELSISVDGDGIGAADLFIDASGVHPGLGQTNCVLVSADTSLVETDVRLHASVIADEGLGALYDVEIQRGSSGGGCERFTTQETIFQGTLAELAGRHGSYLDGITAFRSPAQRVPLRFNGEVRDTNQAQGLAIDYLVHLESKP